jgi:cardiolipin synthase (CMP-forming)
LLTLARIALTPVVVIAIMRERYALALLLCAIAGVTDGFDGYLARRFQWRSRVGAYLDPLADKSLLVLVYLALGIAGAAPRWLVILVLGRDALILLMACAALAFTRIRDFPPSWWGKVSTTVQICSAVDFMAAKAWPAGLFEALVPLGVWLTAAGTLWSGVHYFWIAVRRLQAVRVVGSDPQQLN